MPKAKDSAALAPKQQRFVEEYAVDLNGKQAAIRAGYSAHTAEVQASQLLGKLKVKAAIDLLLAERRTATRKTADDILRELESIGFGAREKASDRNRALELLGKHHKLFTEQHVVSGVVTLEHLVARESGE